MKKYIIECNFEFQSSHGISEVDFEGGSIFNLEEDIQSSCPFGLPNTNIQIINSSEPTFKINIDSLDLLVQEAQVSYLIKLANYLSFLAAKNYYNGNYGTPYVQVNFKDFKATPYTVDDQQLDSNNIILQSFLKLSDSLSITSTNSVKFNKEFTTGVHHNELLTYYYNGLKAESEKSKFFHWFLIIEYIEGSSLYEGLFPKGTMFTEEEKKKVKLLASTFSNDKQNILLSALVRTSEFRNNKLFKLLQKLNISTLSSMQGTPPLTLNTIKSVTSARNKLFHRGSEFPKNILWLMLFPLVTKIVETTIKSKNSLEEEDHEAELTP
jgi:hypothetical protein